MDVTILEHDKNKIKLELSGETHTFANLITKELWKDPSVIISGYHQKHPQTPKVTLILETEKKDAKKVLLDTLESLKKDASDFKTKFKKAVK